MFSALAILCARNEVDILPAVLKHLFEQGIRVHFMDNWSTDGTWEVAFGYMRTGLIAKMSAERFPVNGPSATFDWADILRRKEQIAFESEASWILHHDADEIRRSSREGETLLEGLQRMDALGYTAIDHKLLNYAPKAGFLPGMNPEDFFTELDPQRPDIDSIQVKSWKNLGRVDLARSAGHSVEFPGLNVSAEKFLMKHYPLRTPEHKAAKLADRRSRWNPNERARGWHVQYDNA